MFLAEEALRKIQIPYASEKYRQTQRGGEGEMANLKCCPSTEELSGLNS